MVEIDWSNGWLLKLIDWFCNWFWNQIGWLIDWISIDWLNGLLIAETNFFIDFEIGWLIDWIWMDWNLLICETLIKMIAWLIDWIIGW